MVNDDRLARIRSECVLWLNHPGTRDAADFLAQRLIDITNEEDELESFDGTAHIVLSLNEEELLQTDVKLPKRALFEWMAQMGFYLERPRPSRLRATAPASIPKIVCEKKRACTDYPKKCGDCDYNRARSHFKPKEADE